MNEFERRTLLGAAGLGAIAAMAKAGPLNPPTGAVAGTNKTLQEIADKVARTDSGLAEARTPVSASTTPGNASYLFRITQPGSYYLTGNVQAPANWAGGGIEITAADVTLDLNGFAVVGLGGAAGTLGGIHSTVVSAGRTRLRNGTVRSWRFNGVMLQSHCTVTDVNAELNVGIGFSAGTECTLTRCTAADNLGTGFSIASYSTLLQCVARSNSGNGFASSVGTVAALCTAIANTADGFTGFASVQTCSSLSNNDDGFAVCITADNCTAHSNTGNGFEGCDLVRGCYAGINGGDGTSSCEQVVHSRFNNNAGRGVYLADLVLGCTFEANTLNGVYVSTGSSVVDNRFERPGLTTTSIQAGSRCLVRGNTVVYGGGGIDIANHSLVEGNVVCLNGTTTNVVPAINAFSSMIRNNVVADCSGVGIQTNTGCVVIGNFARSNAGADYNGTGLLGPVVTNQAGINAAAPTCNYSV